MKRLVTLALAALAGVCAAPASATDFSWSGFGTVGVAVSDRDYRYQRFIDRDGTAKRDTVFGAQLDARFSPQWSATVQATLAPAINSDSRWAVTPSWAFVAWRPDDDWLLRLGKMRVPLYLYSQTMDLGQTHDMARLPIEMYSITPTSDFTGINVSRSWPTSTGELTLDAYHGIASTSARYWTRDGVAPVIAPGQRYVDVDVRASGLVATLREPDRLMRLGVHAVRTSQTHGGQLPVTYPRVELAPGLGYYQVNNAIPGPGAPTVGAIHNIIVTAGAEQAFGDGWRITGEFARNFQRDTDFASSTYGGYVALFRQLDRFTPYVSLSELKATHGPMNWYRRLTENPLPEQIPGATQINQAQRIAAEGIWVADQRSIALGTSYALTSNSKLKAEWLHTHVGAVSRLIDTPPGQASPRDTNLNVFSLNYSFVF